MECVRRRGKSYCVVICVPVDLQPIIGKRQIWRSLRTKSYSVARSAARKLLATVEQLFSSLRENMDNNLIKAMVAEHGLGEIERMDKALATASPDPDPDISQDYFQRRYSRFRAASDKIQDVLPGYLLAQSEQYQKDIAKGRFENLPYASASADLSLMWFHYLGLGPAPATLSESEWREVKAAFATAERQLRKVEAERLQGLTPVDSEFQHRLLERWKADKPIAKDTGVTLSELFKAYLLEWSKTHVQARVHRKQLELDRLERSFTECFGDAPRVKAVTAETAVQWRDYMHLEFNEKPLSPKTLKNYIETLTAIFNFGKRGGFVEKNPFSDGLNIPDEAEGSKSRIFEVNELQRYVDYLMEFHDSDRPESTWIPLIMMFSGMRCNEVAQLFVDDVQEMDGIHFLRITNSKERHQSIKCSASKRNVPIHAKLISLGLLEYAGKMRDSGNQQLFPNCTYRPTEGLYYNSNLSGALNQAINLIDSSNKLRLYSLRANFRNSIEEKLVNHMIKQLDGGEVESFGGFSKYYDLALDDIMGHAITGSKGDTVYRKRQLHIMNSVLQLAEYPVNFDKLHLK